MSNAKPKRPGKKPSRKVRHGQGLDAKILIEHALPLWREYKKLFLKVDRMARRAGVDVSDFIQPCPVGGSSRELRLQGIPSHDDFSVTSIHFRRSERKIFLFATGLEFKIEDAPGMAIIKDWAIAMPARYLRMRKPERAIVQDYVDALLRIAHTGKEKDSPAPPARTRSSRTLTRSSR